MFRHSNSKPDYDRDTLTLKPSYDVRGCHPPLLQGTESQRGRVSGSAYDQPLQKQLCLALSSGGAWLGVGGCSYYCTPASLPHFQAGRKPWDSTNGMMQCPNPAPLVRLCNPPCRFCKAAACQAAWEVNCSAEYFTMGGGGRGKPLLIVDNSFFWLKGV